MEEKNFLDALDDWGSILTNTYEDAANTSITLTPKVSPMIFEYIVEEYSMRDDLKPTNNRIDYMTSITFKNTSLENIFYMDVFSGSRAPIGVDTTYEINTTIDNIVINGDTPLIDLIIKDKPLEDKEVVLYLDADGYNTINTTYQKIKDEKIQFTIDEYEKEPDGFQSITLNSIIYNYLNTPLKKDIELKKIVKDLKYNG